MREKTKVHGEMTLMNNEKACVQYTELSGLTATPGELLIMLFNAEIKNIKKAILNINAGNIVDAHNALKKAQAIITELITSLDDKYEISKELKPLYFFIKRELITANVKKDAERLDKILPIVTELRDTWKEANRLSRVK